MKKHRRNTSPSFLIFAALFVSVALTVGVMAKYISSYRSAVKQAGSAEFYFVTAPVQNSQEVPYPVYDGNINFTVKNHDLLNVSENEISYTVSVDSKPDDSTYSVYIDGVEKTSSTLEGNINSEGAVTIPVDKDGNYKIIVTSTRPYAKTITLYYRVNTHYADSFYTVTSHDGWLELDLYTGEDDGDVTVAYGSLQPDNTIDLTSDWSVGTNMSNSLTNLSAYAHYKLIFFGDISLPGNSFVLTQSGKVLEDKSS